MAVDFFLIDAPHTVPAEFVAWENSRERAVALLYRLVDADQGWEDLEQLEDEARAAKAEADHLEQVARMAWLSSIGRKHQ